MKKICIMLLCIIMAVAFVLPFTAFAGTAMEATAKAGDPTIDGKVSDGEYGPAFVLNKDSGTPWGGNPALSIDITFNFAWSAKGLYVAVTYPKTLSETSQIQIDCNPGNQITDAAQQGLFFSILPSGEVLLHNQKTALIEGTPAGASIKDKVTLKTAEDGDNKTTEVLLPIDAFRISDSNFTFAAGEMAFSTFAVITGGEKPETGAAVSSDLSDWTVGKLGLGKLTLEKGADTEPAPDTGTDTEPAPDTGDINWFMPAAFVIAIASFVVVLIFRKTQCEA